MATNTRARLAPDERRTQLLDLGVELLSRRTLDELTIDLLASEAGISRGLLYHYFGNKTDFQLAVVRRAGEGLVAATAPPEGGDPLEMLTVSLEAYLDWALANREGYFSLLAAAGGSTAMREAHSEARDALVDRFFVVKTDGIDIEKTPALRMMLVGWTAMVESLVVQWLDDQESLSRADLITSMVAVLPALTELIQPLTTSRS